MQVTKEQLENVRKGEAVRVNEAGMDIVMLRADLFDHAEKTKPSKSTLESDWKVWFDKIESCRSLKDGWNGYTAPAPNEKAIQNALLFLQVMQLEDVEPTRVAPSAMGGIAITRRVAARKVFLEFYNDGRVFGLFSQKSADMDVVAVDANSLAFRAIVANLREYLDVECAA